MGIKNLASLPDETHGDRSLNFDAEFSPQAASWLLDSDFPTFFF
jgi:hypothetical protein